MEVTNVYRVANLKPSNLDAFNYFMQKEKVRTCIILNENDQYDEFMERIGEEIHYYKSEFPSSNLKIEVSPTMERILINNNRPFINSNGPYTIFGCFYEVSTDEGLILSIGIE